MSTIASDLLSKVPRLEPIAKMIEHQNRPLPPSSRADPETADIRLGTQILRLTLAYEQLIQKGAIPERSGTRIVTPE